MAIIIAPSILSANFASLGAAVTEINDAGAPWVHLDVMDGSFVPVITFGLKTVADLRPYSRGVFDVHLMTLHPQDFIEDFAQAGADYITFHLEACVHAHRTVQAIHAAGKKAGISIVPSTPLGTLEELLPEVDLVLIMTVNPGFGGQAMIPVALHKAKKLRELRQNRGLSFLISVDGGVNGSTIEAVHDAGVDIAVVGSAFFGSPNKKQLVQELSRRSAD